MISSLEEKKISSEVMRLYREAQGDPSTAIEDYLQRCLVDEPLDVKIVFLQKLASQFSIDKPVQQSGPQLDKQVFEKLVPLLLGKQVEEIECSADELPERLAESLNLIFDTLNELILGINTTFMGQVGGSETIRLVIRSNVDEATESISLQSYLAQIKEAFSIMHRAFTDAAMTKMEEMLRELDPRKIEASLNGGMKIGPFQKAEMYKIYEEKYRTLDNWHRTGLLKEALLREFEKHCQQIYAEK
ncbi:type VI secretion system-associated FHA domain protein [Malonomonas rubra]|uniref:type VI secretion system-associated FHA domain protein n=1 Tax=Malonomonas rubra TaxID=57040 RepID=UPI0026EE0622|nr:type VI secretion system-associated FHA domain protein [Malonomonas rubra]